MKDENKTKRRLINKLVELRKQVDRLEESEIQRKQAEESVERLYYQNELVLNAAGEGIFGLDIQGKHTFVNPAAAQMLGYTVHELIGRHSHTLSHYKKSDGSLYPVEECPIYAAYKDGSVHHNDDEVFWRKDGTCFPVAYTSTPIIEDGNIVGAVVTFSDITERKQAQEALRQSEERYRKQFEEAIDAIFLADLGTGMLVDCNMAASKLVERGKSEIIGKHQSFLHPAEDIKDGVSKTFKSHTTGESSELLEDRVITKSGQIKDVAIRASKITIEGKEVMQGIFRDITKRKQAEEALKVREKELEIKTKNLEEINAALNVLLKKREEDKKELEEKVLQNLQQLIEPYMAKLKLSGLDNGQQALVSILESNLKDMTSSFAYRLSSKHLNLTPKEIKVANLIKQGMTSKEICDILGSSEKVIAFHRQNIRKKLGLLNQKVNLKSYLTAKA
jgi:PAS domain S-box-containing protein